MPKQIPGSRLVTDDANNITGVKDTDGDERAFVFDGVPANSLALSTSPDTSRLLVVGELRWNTTDGTPECMLKGGLTILQFGQEQVARFRNVSSADLGEGAAVYVTGSTGTFLTAEPAKGNDDSTSEATIGITTEPIAKNTEGFVTTFGLVRNINTSGLTEGAAVWVSPTVAGGLTSTRPAPPNHAVRVGYCLRTHPSLGVIFVRIHDGYALTELHDVKITNPQDGQVLKYQASTGLWINANP